MYLVVGLFFTAAIVYALLNQRHILVKEYTDLLQKGQIIQGEIIEIEPYSHIMARTKSNLVGGSGARQGVTVKINCETLNNKIIIEDWNYRLKDEFKVGDGIEVYYLNSNFWVKAASVNHRSIALRLLAKTREAASYETPEHFKTATIRAGK